MTSTLSDLDAAADFSATAEKTEILSGQIQNFRRQLLVVGVVQAVNAVLLAGVFYADVNPYLLGVWVAAVWYLAFLCIRSWLRFRDRAERAGRSDATPKTRSIDRAVRSTIVSGVVWGAGSALMFLPDSIPHQLFLVFLIGGMAAGTTAGFSTGPKALIGYVVPSMVPLVVSLAMVG